MAIRLIEHDGVGSRQGSRARYSNHGAVLIMMFWLLIGVALGRLL